VQLVPGYLERTVAGHTIACDSFGNDWPVFDSLQWQNLPVLHCFPAVCPMLLLPQGKSDWCIKLIIQLRRTLLAIPQYACLVWLLGWLLSLRWFRNCCTLQNVSVSSDGPSASVFWSSIHLVYVAVDAFNGTANNSDHVVPG